MTPQRLREVLALLHWSQRGLAGTLGCADSLTRGWARGRSAVPAAVAEWLEELAAFHARHPPPERWRSHERKAA